MNCPTGDYINANHIKMEIPASGIVNRYIAAQGTFKKIHAHIEVQVSAQMPNVFNCQIIFKRFIFQVLCPPQLRTFGL